MNIKDGYVPIGGDFNRVFDHRDYLAMLNVPDEAMCILRSHLILEDFLGLWAAKTTNTDDLFSGTFVPFKTKLVISKNLGLPTHFFEVFDKINEIRNKFSHRRNHALEDSNLESLKTRTNNIPSNASLEKCENFELHSSGLDQQGKRVESKISWKNADNRVKFLITFIILMLKLTSWIQSEFIKRGIDYSIIEMPTQES